MAENGDFCPMIEEGMLVLIYLQQGEDVHKIPLQWLDTRRNGKMLTGRLILL